MQPKIWNKISRRGYALVLALGLLLPGFSHAATVSGETTESTLLGDISVSVTVIDMLTSISISWPENRWVGISFGPTPAHDQGYMIVSSLGGTAYEANAAFRTAPEIQTQQDLTIDSFTTAGGVSEILLSRASNTGDPLELDFQFAAIEQTIPLQWALGFSGDAPTLRHEDRGYFAQDLALVPVPAALPLLASGLFALGLFARRNKAA